MYALYSSFLFFFRILLGILGVFDSKIRRGIEGRKNLFPTIEKYYPTINPLRKRVMIHVSSYGELEQAKPIIAELKKQYPDIHIHLTFFSPSGYENSIDFYKLPDIITYLPFDSVSEVRWFLDITKPNLVLFVRYDLWHNFVHEVHNRNIPMMLFSATFDASAGKQIPVIHTLYCNTYSFINTICTINESDKKAIEQFATHAKKIVVAGDTRCDQVIARRENALEQQENILPDNLLQKITTDGSKVFIAGSVWENDDAVILKSVTKVIENGEKLITIIVPHEVDKGRIDSLLAKFRSTAIILSEIGSYKGEKIIIVDSIGKLFTLYRSAAFAYIGGGFGAGVHNTLEPAVWGVPSIVGPNHRRSKEVGAIIGLGGAVEIHNAHEFEDVFDNWLVSDMARNVAAATAKNYVYASQGATGKIMAEISSLQW